MKKVLAIMLAAVMLLAALAGCNKPGGNGGDDLPPPEATEDGGMTYADTSYFPIVKEPITLTAMLSDTGTRGDYSQRTLWAEMKERTNIEIKVRLIVNTGSGETASLIYASRDYPDISFRNDSANWKSLIHEAALLGDIVELTDEMIQSFAPNWYNIFKENPDVYKMSVHTDGKLYGLPHCEMEESAIMLRDCHFINSDWLDELGMAKPETLGQFTDYLRAVKNAAGTGSIPSNVVPLYIRANTNIGGWYSFCDMFGVFNGLNNEIVVDGKVVNNAQDPNLKLPLKYLRSLFEEGLWSRNSYTDYTQYIIDIDESNTATQPWFIGSFFGFWNCNHEFLDYLPPLKAADDIDPLVRPFGITARLLKDNFFIFSNCQYPVAALRLMDAYADTKGALRLLRGEEGYTYMLKEDGTYTLNPDENVVIEDKYKALYDYGPGIIGADIMMQLNQENLKDETDRIWAYYNIYKPYLPDNMELFPDDALNFLSPEENAEITSISTLLKSYTNNMVGKWILAQGDIDADWDGFQQKLLDLKIARKLELYQKAWDLYSANVIE